MLKITFLLFCFVGLSFSSNVTFSQNHKKKSPKKHVLNPNQNKWLYLGQKVVSDRLDHDVIKVTAKKGNFKSIYITVKGASVDFHKVVVLFANGSTQKIKMRKTIPSGGQTRAIDLNGKDRFIKEIRFWYDANVFRKRKNKQKTFVRVWGKM